MPLPLELLGLENEDKINVHEIHQRVENGVINYLMLGISSEVFEQVYRIRGTLDSETYIFFALITQDEADKEKLIEYSRRLRHEDDFRELDQIPNTSSTNLTTGTFYFLRNYALSQIQLGRKYEFKNGLKRLLDDYINQALDRALDEEHYIAYIRSFAKAKIMYPEVFSEQTIPAYVYEELEKYEANTCESIESAVTDMDYGEVSAFLGDLINFMAFYRLAAPEKFRDANVFERRRKYISMAESLLRSGWDHQLVRYVDFFGCLSILYADSIKYTDNGIELVWDDEEFDTSKADVPKLPSVRRF